MYRLQFMCTGNRKKQKKSWFGKYEEIKNQSAILHLIFEALEGQRLIRVSLKSRKIYIGMVSAEQFERLDMDNIVLIPYFSGHRDKDTLQINLETNYTTVYFKKGLLQQEAPATLAEELPQLKDFGKFPTPADHHRS